MNPTLRFPPLTVSGLRQDFAAGRDPAELLWTVYERIAIRGEDSVWIHLAPIEEVVKSLPTDRALPLFGMPFAVKDNIDVAGWPTTAACPSFSYVPQRDATVVARLKAAGAIPIGKTNMDQFATGLVGTRSPYGVPSCVFDEKYLSGGSSSGSAVAVAAGLVPFALGTDTAGSGRVPAAFNDLVGWKPSRGLLSTLGVVPACRSLDCVSIFTRNVADGEEVMGVASGFDASDSFSRKAIELISPRGPLRFGIPAECDLEFFGDEEAASLFHAAVTRLEQMGHQRVEINFPLFRDAARLLYHGPWVAERLATLETFLQTDPVEIHPVVRQIISGGGAYTAVDTFRGQYELAALQRRASAEWERMDVLLLPTTGTTFRIEETLANPVELNTKLGYYTNFVNLLDLCAVAVPAGFRSANGLPFGVTLLAPAFSESLLGRVAREYAGEPPSPTATAGVELAVVGAHLLGQPLNHQLTSRHGQLVRQCRTAPGYRLYALAGTVPPKPGLVREPGFAGAGIEVEVWSLTTQAFGDFVANVPAPMSIGTVELEDGTSTKGFLCEPCALAGAEEITQFGGWRAYLGRSV